MEDKEEKFFVLTVSLCCWQMNKTLRAHSRVSTDMLLACHVKV